MPPLTRFVDGTGPVFAGKLFPFAFITIACGAISGFHELVASGTTPKLVMKESHTRLIGYGGMLTESFVGLMAIVAAATLEPGVYFAMNRCDRRSHGIGKKGSLARFASGRRVRRGIGHGLTQICTDWSFIFFRSKNSVFICVPIFFSSPYVL